MSSDFWNERYNSKTYAFGKLPNEFFRKCLKTINDKGKLLLPAEGEGRNAIYAARKGWEVHAFDGSSVAKNKALDLAKENQVEINYDVVDMKDVQLKAESFDCLSLVYAHFPVEKRQQYHRELFASLKKGGFLVLEGFAKGHLEYKENNPRVGGPGIEDMLFSKEDILSDFKEVDIIEFWEGELLLEEGVYHNGVGKVLRVLAKKK